MFYFNLISVISACVFDRKRRKETIYSTVRVSVTRVFVVVSRNCSADADRTPH